MKYLLLASILVNLILACKILAMRLSLIELRDGFAQRCSLTTDTNTLLLRTNLKDDGVTSIFLQLVQLVGQRLLHLQGRHSLELSVDTLYPCSTELTFLLCLSR